MHADRLLSLPRLFLGVLLLCLSFTAWATPKIQHWTLQNGARVYFVEARDLPMVAFNVVFDAGAARDPRDRGGLANLVSSLLNDGTGDLDANAIAARFEGLGAEYSASTDRDMAGASLRSLSDRKLLDAALDLYARLLAAPSFPAAGLERERAQVLLGLRQAGQSAGTVAKKAFYAQLYGDHPYARDPDGDEAGLKAVSRDDLVAFHRRYYVGRNAVLAMIGDLRPGEAREIAERVLGALPAGESPPPLARVPDSTPAGRAERHLNHPSSQTHILIGEAGMRRNDPDYFPLFLGNFVLGGNGLISRLSQEVRNERGLAYSVYSYFLPLREHGPFVLGLQTKNSQRDEALAVVRRVLARYADEGPTEDELAAAKKNITGGFPLRIDSNRKIADYLTVIGFYGLPLTYLDDFIPRIEAVTAGQIRDAFRRRVHPAHMVTVTVGGQGD